MGRRQKFRVEEVLQALKGSRGILTTVAARLGCGRATVSNYIERYPTLAEAFEEERATLCDMAESVLANNIALALERQQAEHQPVDSSDAKWVLARLGKDRGYMERQEISGPGGEPVVIKFVRRDDEG